MMPVFSIVIPTYNRASTISRTLDSVLSQTFQNWECLVVDDFSVDNTKNIVEMKEYIINYDINLNRS